MSTFLEIVQDLARECDIGSVPSAVTSQTGEFADLVRWVQKANVDVCNRHEGQWRFLRRTARVTTSANNDTYAYGDFTDTGTSATVDRFARWRAADPYDPPKIYLSSAGSGAERWMTFTPWEWFKTVYRIGTQNSGAPAHITVDPSNNILIGPKPNDAYVLTVDYYRSPLALAADADEPEFPERFHDVLVYRPMEKYAYRESASEVLARAQSEGRRLMAQLEYDQLEPVRFGGPLA